MGELALQRWRPQDRDALYAAVSSTLEHLRPWMPWVADYDRSSTGQFLARCEDGWARGESFEYAILAGDGQILGSTGLMTRIAPGGLEIGYWVHGAHTRKRVATRAVAALAEAALRLSWVTHVEIHHDEANVASGGVPRRLGFQLVSAVGRDPTTPPNGAASFSGEWTPATSRTVPQRGCSKDYGARIPRASRAGNGSQRGSAAS